MIMIFIHKYITMKEIKHLFFTYRNGIVADTLRKAGYPYKTIFGLEIPRLAEIAGTQKPSMELADALWADRDVRESRVLACYLFPLGEMTPEKCMALASDVQTREEADMLAFRVFKRLPFAADLLRAFGEGDADALKVCAKALRPHLE